jgi:hypothetical protein
LYSQSGTYIDFENDRSTLGVEYDVDPEIVHPEDLIDRPTDVKNPGPMGNRDTGEGHSRIRVGFDGT